MTYDQRVMTLDPGEHVAVIIQRISEMGYYYRNREINYAELIRDEVEQELKALQEYLIFKKRIEDD